jgi:enamine deaminase RidA (YjgF/YER057c/UK114 family)
MDYGVTFERGLAVDFGDRRHLYISGTASIDKAGRILHEGDVQRQTGRALDNIAALLKRGGAGLADLAYAIIYLRDFADAPAVERILAERLGSGIPRVMLLARVCRPGWLVEIEGLAITPRRDPRYGDF